MATITNEEEFRVWLEGKPREVAITIAARIALRILPSEYKRYNHIFGLDRFVNDAIFAFRSTAFIWVASQSWNIPVLPSAIKIYSEDVKSSALFPFGVLSNLVQDKRPRMAVSMSAIIARHASFSLARDREGAQFYQSSLSNSASEFWRAIQIDATFIDEASSKAPWKALGASSLWLDEIQSESQAELWLNLKSVLQTARADWDVWTDWYEARLAGKRPRRKDIEIFRVTLDDAAADGLFPERTQNEWEEALRAHDADWEKGPAHVNALIKARIEPTRALRHQRRVRAGHFEGASPIWTEEVQKLGDLLAGGGETGQEKRRRKETSPALGGTASTAIDAGGQGAPKSRSRKAKATAITATTRVVALLQSAAIQDLIDERVRILENNLGINDFEARDQEIAQLNDWRTLADEVSSELKKPTNTGQNPEPISESLAKKLTNALCRCIDEKGSALMSSALGGVVLTTFLGISSALGVNLHDSSTGLTSVIAEGVTICGPNFVAAVGAVFGRGNSELLETAIPAKPKKK